MYQPILATLAYVLSPDGCQVLLIHRNKRDGDAHLGKYNGLGGKLHGNENIITSVRRELWEEAGITCDDPEIRGTISWPGFGSDGTDWFGFIFLVRHFTGTPHTTNAEGDLVWVAREKILDLPMWEGDRYFVPLVFDASVRQFHGVMPYKEGKPVSWQCEVTRQPGQGRDVD